jgi:hypothetical protein
MQELRFVAVSEDGRYAVLAVPGRSARFTLPIDERLRAVALGQTSRLVQYEIEVESPLRPKEIQARIRAGETVEEIADAAGIAVERVRWFEGPVLAERAYMADQAQRASVRRRGDSAPSTPGPRLGEIVAERLQAFGSDPEDAQWDAKKRGDGSWQVQLAFVSSGRLHEAQWVFDPRRRHVSPADDNAVRISLPGGEPPQPAEPPPGEATVTQLAPRLSSAAGQGFGQSGTGTSGFAPVGSGHGGSGHGGSGHGGSGNGGPGNGGPGNGGPGNGGPGNGGRARHERPGPSRPPVSEPAPSAPAQPAQPAPEVPAAVASETGGEDLRPPAAGRHSPAQPVAPEPSRPAKAPVTEPLATAATPPVTPATIAAQVSNAGRAPQPTGTPQPTRAPESSQPSAAAGASEPEAKEPRPETTVPAARPESTVPVAAAASPARGAKPESAAPAEPASEQAGRQSRKSARGKRASVPSWDEIMFGSARQRD